MATLTSLLGNSQRLDGGAMFGNAPRTVWETWAPADAQHRIELACRALLVEDGARKILLETGIGAFFAPAMRERFGVNESEHVLLRALAQHGVTPEAIDAIVLSHLHFDHAGGLLTEFSATAPLALAFPNARFIVSQTAWARATAPHARDKASFIPELAPLLTASGRLELVTSDRSPTLGDGFRFHFSDGHTPGLMLTEVAMPSGPVVFASDLIPGRPWVHAPITMGYDRFPELLIDEKSRLLADLTTRNGKLFFTHDPHIAMGTVTRDAKGRYTTTNEVPALTRLT